MLWKLFSHRFVSATFWMFVATGFLNVGNYLYHLLMGRMLGPSLYGVLESIISLFYILGVPLLTLTLVIVKFTSTYKGRGDYKGIAGLYHYINGKILLFGSLFSLAILVLSPFIVGFLHLPSIWLVVILSGTFFVSLFNIMVKSFLQGLTNFFGMAVTNFGETAGKLTVAVLFVILGMKVQGALLGIGVGLLLGYLVSLIFLQKAIIIKGVFTQRKEFFVFSLPVFLANLSLISLFTTDILLVRHFFGGVESGYYAAASVLGKIIFFAASPITLVMFPFISEHHAAKKQYGHFLLISFILTTAVVLSLTFFYFALPAFVTSLLFGKEYISIAPLLGQFAIFISIYTLCSLMTNFYLSIHKTKIVAAVLLASLLQIIFIVFFHKSLFEIIKVSIVTTFLLLITLMLYYAYAKKVS